METTEEQSRNDNERPLRLRARRGDGPQPVVDDRPDLPSPHYEEEIEEPEAPVIVVAEPPVAPALDRGYALPRPSVEALLWIATIASAAIVRLASLTNFPFSAAEGQRAYAAWQFADGQGARVDGALWGPFPFLIDALSFFLFGTRDTIARLGPALAGIALVLVCWSLRPYFGRWGALGVAAMLALSPTFVYGSRQVSGLPWSLLAALVLFACLLRLADERVRPAPALVIGAVALAFLLGSGAAGLTMLLAFALALAILFAWHRPRDVEDAEDEPAISLRSLREHFRRRDRRVLSGALALLVILLLVGFSLVFTDLIHLPRTVGSLYSHWWGDLFTTQRNAPWYSSLLIAFAYEPFIGVAAIIGIVLIYRMASPRPLVAMLPLVWQGVALLLFSLSGGKTPETATMILLPLALIGGIGVEWIGERLRGGWFWRERGWVIGLAAFIAVLTAVQFLRELVNVDRSAAWIATILALIVIILAAGYVTTTLAARRGQFQTTTALLATLLFLCLVVGVRAMSGVTFSRPADGRELLVGTHTASSITPLVQRIQRISLDLTRNDRTYDPATGDTHNITGGNASAIAVDSSLEWPFRWYFRDFPNFSVGDAQAIAAAQPPTGQDGKPLPRIVIVPSTLDGQVAPQLSGYVSQQYPATVSFPASYRTMGTGEALLSLVNPHTWADWLRYFASRRTPQPPTTTDLTVYLNQEVANKVFFAGTSSAQTTPYNLFDHAGKGKAPGQFSAPRGIGIGPDGVITIVDQLNYRVEQFQPDGTFLRQWGGIGTAPDKFGQINGYAFGPTGLAVAQDGTIYVADTWNHRISVFTSTGTPLRQWGKYFNGQDDPSALPNHTGEFYGPRGIAIGPNSLLYVTDTGNSRIQVFDTNGKFIRAFGSLGTGPGQMDNPVGIAVRADGTIAVADTNNARVLLFNADGTYIAALTVSDWAAVKGLEAYIGFLPNGNLLVPSPTGNRLIEMTTQGQTVRTITSNDLHKPVSFALTADGTTALVVNDETNTVVKVSLQ